MRLVSQNAGISLGLLRNGMPIYGFIYDYGRDNLLQGGKEFGSIEGSEPVQASTDLINEKLTFVHALPHSHKGIRRTSRSPSGVANSMPLVPQLSDYLM